MRLNNWSIAASYDTARSAEVRVAPFFPSLPATASLAPEVASDVMKKGYHVAEINRSGTYLITDGGSQAWAIVTQRGVILVDVPEPLPFRPPLRVVPAIADKTMASLFSAKISER